jgi:hypothetical protein
MCPETSNLRRHALLSTLSDSGHGHHGGDTDNDTERCERAAQPVGRQGLGRYLYAVIKGQRR